jgi:SpoVK/Ycf46/Vps4 family AAA+-type ATPase
MKQNDDKAVIVIDEADNILNTQDAWFRIGETQDKGWLNKLLEDEGIRMIWITNTIDAIDESVKRRFTYSIHFKAFNCKQRVQLWESISKKNRIKNFYDQKEIQQLAKNYKVSAGVIDLAVQKSVETYSIRKKSQCKRAIVQALEAYQTLTYQGYKPVQKNNIEECYSLDGLNIEGNLTTMIKQLETFDVLLRQKDRKRNINMNLLFYGPPGTGKSELARYISHHLDRELICKRASDIFDPYVGMTERNMRDMFNDAENEDAVLIIDEADSLLCSRDRAVRSWEFSFTNEFLTQMERFNGILICTTNRLKDLDTASIRRFNHKIEFNYLTPQGNIIFYNLFLAPLNNGVIDEKTKNTLSTMNNLSPGDFKVVRDRYSLANEEGITHDDLIRALQDECRAKELNSPSIKIIGF